MLHTICSMPRLWWSWYTTRGYIEQGIIRYINTKHSNFGAPNGSLTPSSKTTERMNVVRPFPRDQIFTNLFPALPCPSPATLPPSVNLLFFSISLALASPGSVLPQVSIAASVLCTSLCSEARPGSSDSLACFISCPISRHSCEHLVE